MVNHYFVLYTFAVFFKQRKMGRGGGGGIDNRNYFMTDLHESYVDEPVFISTLFPNAKSGGSQRENSTVWSDCVEVQSDLGPRW